MVTGRCRLCGARLRQQRGFALAVDAPLPPPVFGCGFEFGAHGGQPLRDPSRLCRRRAGFVNRQRQTAPLAKIAGRSRRCVAANVFTALVCPRLNGSSIHEKRPVNIYRPLNNIRLKYQAYAMRLTKRCMPIAHNMPTKPKATHTTHALRQVPHQVTKLPISGGKQNCPKADHCCTQPMVLATVC